LPKNIHLQFRMHFTMGKSPLFISQHPPVYIGEIEGKGRAVFAARDIQRGELIEICPMLVLSPADRALADQTILFNYLFIWCDDEQHAALALGYGSLYNHAYYPNARYFVDYETNIMEVHAIKNIKSGDEICFSYNGDPTDRTPIWFDAK
jgi:SET domain-containing protein